MSLHCHATPPAPSEHPHRLPMDEPPIPPALDPPPPEPGLPQPGEPEGVPSHPVVRAGGRVPRRGGGRYEARRRH